MGAAAAYQQAIQLAPTFAQAHHSWAVVLSEQGDYEAAIDRFRAVIVLNPGAVKAYNNIGCILIQQGKFDQARQLYQEALAIESGWAVLHNHFGKAIEAQDPVAAIAAYRQAIQLQPDLVSAHYNLGQALYQQRQYEAAIACFENLLVVDPRHVTTHTACGLAFIALSKWDQALDHFRQALLPHQAQIRAFCAWVDPLSGNDALTLARQACSQFLQSLLVVKTPLQDSKAVSSVNFTGRVAGVVLDQNRPADIHQHLAQTYLQLGNVLMQYGGSDQYRQAESHYQAALQLHPHCLDLYLKLAECLRRQQRWNAACWIDRLALTLFPSAASLHQSLGYTLEQQGRWVDAIAYYRQTLKFTENQRSIELPIDQACPATPSVISGPQPASSVSSQQSQIQGFHASTLEWAAHVPSCQGVVLEPDGEAEQGLRRATVIAAIPSNTANPGFSNRAEPIGASGSCNRTASDPASDSGDRLSCGGLNCHRCLEKIVKQFSPIHLGKGVYTCHAQASGQEPPPYFVAQIPQAQAWMTPYQTPWMVANSIAILTPDRYVLADVSREYPGQLPGCNRSHSTFERILQHQDDSVAEQISGSVAVLAGLSGHNYFHWMVDVLPRFELLRRSGIDLATVDWFWINDPQSSFQRETLRILGIPVEKVLASDRHPHIQADQLIVPSFPGYLGWLEPWALAFLRQQFLAIADAQAPRYERIYISRSNAHHRRLLNESAVLDCLKAHGFVSVELESLTLAEQVALFVHAKIIIAPHGGGLTNLLFCTPGTTVVEFFAPSYIRHYYWVISQQLGLHHYFVQGEPLNCMPIQQLMYPSPLMEDIWIDLQALRAVLSRLGLS